MTTSQTELIRNIIKETQTHTLISCSTTTPRVLKSTQLHGGDSNCPPERLSELLLDEPEQIR